MTQENPESPVSARTSRSIADCTIDPMFPTQVRVNQDGLHIWLHSAAHLFRWLDGASCSCMNGRRPCDLHGTR